MAKQKIMLSTTQQFKIPAPHRAWCHVCEIGFKNIAELQKHNADRTKHQVPRKAVAK